MSFELDTPTELDPELGSGQDHGQLAAGRPAEVGENDRLVGPVSESNKLVFEGTAVPDAMEVRCRSSGGWDPNR
jgi:hypothetical protein